MIDFYISLKNNVITDEEYFDVKNRFKILKMRNIVDLNDLYNFQETIIPCKIFVSRVSLMNEQYKITLRRCIFASLLSGSIQRNQSKVIILLPTNTETVKLLKKRSSEV